MSWDLPPPACYMTTRALRPEEVDLIESYLAKEGRFRDRLLVILLVSTGFRVSEILTLTIGQVVASDGQVARDICVARRDLKGGKGAQAKGVRSRRVPLNERARSAIGDYLASLKAHPTRDTYLFRSQKGLNEPVQRGHAHKIVKSAAWDAGVDATFVGCHSCRRSFAKQIFTASGHNILAVQRLLGHRSPLTSMAYLSADSEELDGLVLGLASTAASTAAGGSTIRPPLNPMGLFVRNASGM
jgi:integrase